MNPRFSSLRTWLILLFIVVGPVQAQVAFACSMMEEVVLDDCCCDEGAMDSDCRMPDCDNPTVESNQGCCDRLVSIGVDQDVRHDTPAVKLGEPKSGLDPPLALIAEVNLHPFPIITVVVDFSPATFSGSPGNLIYLQTQRLRL